MRTPVLQHQSTNTTMMCKKDGLSLWQKTYLCGWEGLFSTEPVDCKVIASEICDTPARRTWNRIAFTPKHSSLQRSSRIATWGLISQKKKRVWTVLSKDSAPDFDHSEPQAMHPYVRFIHSFKLSICSSCRDPSLPVPKKKNKETKVVVSMTSLPLSNLLCILWASSLGLVPFLGSASLDLLIASVNITLILLHLDLCLVRRTSTSPCRSELFGSILVRDIILDRGTLLLRFLKPFEHF